MIQSLRGKYSFLSNFEPCDVFYDGIFYKNAEAAFQSAKTTDIKLRNQFRNISSREAKAIGNKIHLRYDWESIKEEVMYDVVKDKFTRNLLLKNKLLATGKKVIYEGNTWHDNFFGYCTCERCRHIKKQNKLGEILMRVRDEIILSDNSEGVIHLWQ